jgi:hypothetical protein
MDIPKDARPDAILHTKAERDEDFAEEMWRLRHPEKDGQKLTLVEVMAHLQEKHCICIKSVSSVSGFYKWLAVRRDFQHSRNVVHQIKEEMRKDASMTPEAIERAGVVMLATRGIQLKDAKLFASMMKIGQGRTKLDQNDKRLKQTDKSLEMEARRVAMLEAKAAFYDAVKEKAKDAGSGGVTAEQMEDIERRLKMM